MSLSVDGMQECRIVVYRPDDEETIARAARLRDLRRRRGRGQSEEREIPPPGGDGIIDLWT